MGVEFDEGNTVEYNYNNLRNNSAISSSFLTRLAVRIGLIKKEEQSQKAFIVVIIVCLAITGGAVYYFDLLSFARPPVEMVTEQKVRYDEQGRKVIEVITRPKE